jgi:hypothetical protein
MKTAISIPDRVFLQAEQLAVRLRVSRSALYARALAALIDKHRDDWITARLNAVYGPGGEESPLDPALAALQHRSLARRGR